MPRSKSAKRTSKRASKRASKPATKRVASKPTTANNTFATVQKMEKDFLKVPGQLASSLTREVSSLKQKEAKLKAAGQKLKAQIKTAETRMKAANKNKNTATGKKQFSAAKKMHAESVKSQSGVNKDLQETVKSLENVGLAQTRLLALHKHLTQFEKEWAKQAKQLKAKALAKAKAKPKKSKNKRSAAAPAQTPMMEDHQPETRSFDSAYEEIQQDENIEITNQ